MTIRKWYGTTFTFRWPWRVTGQDNDFRAELPRWAKPYKWFMEVVGYPLLTITSKKK